MAFVAHSRRGTDRVFHVRPSQRRIPHDNVEIILQTAQNGTVSRKELSRITMSAKKFVEMLIKQCQNK